MLTETGVGGGQTGIRTLETVTRLHTFQACAFDHSATCPLGRCVAFVWQRNQGVFAEKSKNNWGSEIEAQILPLTNAKNILTT